MSEDFDPSPRASKRRKFSTYGSSRPTRTKTDSPVSSIWDNVSNSVTGLSRRLFAGSKSSTQPEEPVVELQDDIQPDGGLQADAEDIQEIAESESEPVAEAFVNTRRGSRGEGRSSTRAPASKTRTKMVNQDSDKAQGSQKIAATGEKKQRAGATSRSASGRLRGESIDVPGSSGGRSTTETVMDNVEEDSVTVQPRSSGRERKKTRKYSTEPVEIQESPKISTKSTPKPGTAKQKSSVTKKIEQPALVGILTPSKRNEKKARKSVVFDEGDEQIETDFGFRDIASSTKIAERSAADPQQNFKPSVVPKKLKQKPREESIVIQPEPETDSHADEELLFGTTFQEPVVDITALQSDHADLTEDSPELLRIKVTNLARLTNRAGYTERPPLPSHLKSAYDTLHTLLRTTVASGESNSLLLLGSRGAGKSLLVNHALENLRRDLSTDFHTVRLNGFIQTDDRLALREIWRQLGREMEVDESETNQVGGSYADTMTSLLGLLSQPEEVPDIGAVEYAAEKVVTKSVVFILDEFDLFTTHPRQTLLYNLFDIAQSRKAPIAVIGCSARTDCVECLEKRVKSRFSHRWVHVPQPRNLVAFEEVVRDNLLVDEMRLGDTVLEQECAGTWNEYIKASFTPAASRFIYTNNL
jgi:origin recognition complex subunit 4